MLLDRPKIGIMEAAAGATLFDGMIRAARTSSSDESSKDNLLCGCLCIVVVAGVLTELRIPVKILENIFFVDMEKKKR